MDTSSISPLLLHVGVAGGALFLLVIVIDIIGRLPHVKFARIVSAILSWIGRTLIDLGRQLGAGAGERAAREARRSDAPVLRRIVPRETRAAGRVLTPIVTNDPPRTSVLRGSVRVHADARCRTCGLAVRACTCPRR